MRWLGRLLGEGLARRVAARGRLSAEARGGGRGRRRRGSRPVRVRRARTRGRSEVGGRARHRRRFALYSLYAWGVPALLATAAIVVNENGERWGVPSIYRPNIATVRCFLVRGTLSRALYLQGSGAVMVGVNVVLFALTARRCSRVKAEMARLSRGGAPPSYYCSSSTHGSSRHSSASANGTGGGGGGGDAGPQRRAARFRADCDR
ncbi:G-protein coupled receptor Mth2 [Gryllus bimaculatus]|nr:G-protein coupled receptor Mth2 [Gryllus bimaculatus]